MKLELSYCNSILQKNSLYFLFIAHIHSSPLLCVYDVFFMMRKGLDAVKLLFLSKSLL